LIGVVVIGLAAVAVSVLHSIQKGNAKAPLLEPAAASVLHEVSSVAGPEQDAIGLPPSVSVPKVADRQPALVLDGHPAAIFIGGEFCPSCAAERWAVVMAFSRFGTFSSLKETTSSPWDSYPSTPTFSFYKSSYKSPYVTLLTVEREGNDTSGLGTRTTLQSLTPLESALWARYEQAFGQAEAFPFLDIGNKVFVVSPSYDPGVLAGLTQSKVAARLRKASAPSTAEIVATATYLTAAICSLTGQRPSSACSLRVVREAARSMRIG